MAKLPENTEPLARALAAASGRLLAVLDGAHFDDLQGTLALYGLPFRPLYLDEENAPALASGPHLVPLTGPFDIEHVRRIVADKPACVFWSWPGLASEAETAIYRHLRTIGMIEIPTERYDAPEPTMRPGHADHQPEIPPYEPVLLRHADPNVIAMTFSVLNASQARRIMGDAYEVIVDTTLFGGVRTFRRSEQEAKPTPGMLKLDHEQYHAVAATYQNGILRRLQAYYSRNDSEDIKQQDEAQIADSVSRAHSYGLFEFEQIDEFVRLDLETGARFEMQDGYARAKRHLMDRDLRPSLRVSEARKAIEDIRYADRHRKAG